MLCFLYILYQNRRLRKLGCVRRRTRLAAGLLGPVQCLPGLKSEYKGRLPGLGCSGYGTLVLQLSTRNLLFSISIPIKCRDGTSFVHALLSPVKEKETNLQKKKKKEKERKRKGKKKDAHEREQTTLFPFLFGCPLFYLFFSSLTPSTKSQVSNPSLRKANPQSTIPKNPRLHLR
ncbi:hypothetical protein HZ326_10452, partial [Fusarium oxysporum f. sp. albedinis]